MGSSKLKYNFQSVGDPSEVIKEIEKRRKKQETGGVPLSIKTPLAFATRAGDLFEMHTDQQMVIRDNLRNLLLTNHGERLSHYDFGANLMSVVNELGSEDGDQLAMALIQQAVAKYMPFVSLSGFEAQSQPVDGNPVTIIRVTYTVPAIDPEGLKEQSVEVSINFDG